MLKKPYPKNCFSDFNNPSVKNHLIEQVTNWWLKDNFYLGLEKCINKVNKFF